MPGGLLLLSRLETQEYSIPWTSSLRERAQSRSDLVNAEQPLSSLFRALSCSISSRAELSWRTARVTKLSTAPFLTAHPLPLNLHSNPASCRAHASLSLLPFLPSTSRMAETTSESTLPSAPAQEEPEGSPSDLWERLDLPPPQGGGEGESVWERALHETLNYSEEPLPGAELEAFHACSSEIVSEVQRAGPCGC